jgi:lipid-A-disaccharide synthase
MSRQAPLIFIVSGEASGDNLAGRLMAALKAKTGGRVRFAGIGGRESEAQGLTSLFPMQELSVAGLAEILPHLPRLVRRLNQTANAALTLKPDAVVTVDSPGFSLRLARHLQGSGIPVVHYVAPQLWAWRPGRAKKLGQRVAHIMALLPFEPAFFAKYGIACTFVGHPAIESGAVSGDGAGFRAKHAIPAEATVLCVVPGSRPGEARRMLPILGAALEILKLKHPHLHLVVPLADTTADAVAPAARNWPYPVAFASPAERFDAFAASDAAMAKSGTVTLELALAGVPMVIGYRINPATAFLVRQMGVSVKYASLVNLLAEREVIPEYLQENCTAENLAAGIDRLLESEEARDKQREGFREVLHLLGDLSPPPSERAAKVVLDIVARRTSQAAG